MSVHLNVARSDRQIGMTVQTNDAVALSASEVRGGAGSYARSGTTAYWNEHLSFIPKRGEIIIYTDHGTIEDRYGSTINVPGVKVGDGSAYLVDLPFAGDDVRYQILTELRLHSENTEIHVTAEEKTFWNNKLNCIVSGGNLILNRL
jgi:hypothetical protein